MLTERKRGSWFEGVSYVVLVVGMAIWAYHGSVVAPWLFDDHVVIEKISMPEESFWGRVWVSPRPLRQLTFLLDAWMWGGAEAMRTMARAENLALHVGVALLWGLLLRRLGQRRWVAWGAAAVFAVLPLHWETLGVASHRKELLAAAFGLLGILGLLGRNRWGKAVGLICFGLAALGKETGVVYAGLGAFLEWWRSRGEGEKVAWGWLAAAIGTGLALGVLAWAQTKWSMENLVLSWDGDMRLGEASGWLSGAWKGLRSFPRYVALVAGWGGPCFDRTVGDGGWADGMLSGAFWLAWGWGVWRGSRRGKAWGAALAWEGGALLVVLAPPLLGSGKVALLAGRYAYGAALGWAWLVALGAEWLSRRAGRVWGWVALGAVLMAYGALTRGYAPEFVTERTMWEASVRRNPHSRLACHNLVQAIRRDGDIEGALAFLARHIRKLGENPFLRRSDDGKTVVAVAGDSVPYGWEDNAPALGLSLAARLGKRAEGAGEGEAWRFMNWAVPGSTLTALPRGLAKRLRENPTDCCVIMTGHNDALAGLGADEMVRRAEDVLIECLMGGARPVWVGPVPVRSVPDRDRELQAATLDAFGRRMEDVCTSNGIRYLDFATRVVDSGRDWVGMESGVHLNYEGMENLAGYVFWEGLKTPAPVAAADTAPKTPLPNTKLAPGRVRFALCQTTVRRGDVAANAAHSLALAEEAAAAGADVVVFPELSFVSVEDLLDGLEPENFEDASWGLEAFGTLARREKCWIVVNHPRKGKDGQKWNETLVVGPQGSVEAAYRKRMLALVDERLGMEPGESWTVAEIASVRVGFLICKDASFPEVFSAEFSEVDVLLAQFAHVQLAAEDSRRKPPLPFAKRPEPLERIAARCSAVTRKPLLLVDQTGVGTAIRMLGGSCALDATGQVVARAGGKEETLFVDMLGGEMKRKIRVELLRGKD